MKTKHNVLILFTDQQRYDTIAAGGFRFMKTPNIDRLAEMGTLFSHAYSTNPVCMPARHDLITGLPGKAHGYYENADKPISDYSLPTLPRIFSNHGWRTAAIGKCHHYPVRAHHGFGEMFLMEELPENRPDDQYAMFLKENGYETIQNLHGVRPHIYHIPQSAQMDLAHHGTTWVAERTCQWLEDNQDAPFLLFCGFIHPHPPWDLPDECQGMYSECDLPEAIKPSRQWPHPQKPSQWFGDHDTEEQKRKIREAYYTSISMVDTAVGRILDRLEQRGQLENTLIIFTSDHGEMLQDKGFYSKELPYDASARVPFILKLPENLERPAHMEKGTVSDCFVNTFDILPTCLDVCGLPYPENTKYMLPGNSVLDTGIFQREFQISSFCSSPSIRWIMTRNRNFKYIWNYNGGTEECYDLAKDPGETTDLFWSGDVPECIGLLRNAALEWEKKWGPQWAVKDGRLNVCERKELHPSHSGKFHKWSNVG